MLTTDDINQLLGITESYQAPAKMLALMLDVHARPKLFDAFLDRETNMRYEWFQYYYESEHADLKVKKQDFTPMSVSRLLARLSNQDSRIYFESAAGTGGIMIQQWAAHRDAVSPIQYDPWSYWYQVEELSDRSIPFLIFNMAIRGMNGVAMHGDSLTRKFKDVYFIRNNTNDYLCYSEIIQMPHTDAVKQELDVSEWISN